MAKTKNTCNTEENDKTCNTEETNKPDKTCNTEENDKTCNTEETDKTILNKENCIKSISVPNRQNSNKTPTSNEVSIAEYFYSKLKNIPIPSVSSGLSALSIGMCTISLLPQNNHRCMSLSIGLGLQIFYPTKFIDDIPFVIAFPFTVALVKIFRDFGKKPENNI